MQQEEMAGFQLSPPQMKDIRPSAFKQIIFSFYYWRWQQACPWDQSEQAQLSRLLKCSPSLDADTFKQWLYNYGRSEDITPGERPRRFLPRIHNYCVGTLDRYGRQANVETDATLTAIERARQDRQRLANHVHTLRQAPEARPNQSVPRRPLALPSYGD